MKILHVAANGFILACTNLAAIIAAFGIYHVARQSFPQVNQVAIQASIAAIFSLIGFSLWVWIIKKYMPSLVPHIALEWIFIFVFSLAVVPLIFVPLHYFTQGYLTAFSNITAIWMFQIPVNLMACLPKINRKTSPSHSKLTIAK